MLCYDIRLKDKRHFGLIQAVEEKSLGFIILQNIHLYEKYLLPEKISLLTSLQAEINGLKTPPHPPSFFSVPPPRA